MAGRVAGAVALITGAARGQGRAHAVRLAGEGADVVLVDVCGPVPSQGTPVATPEDLDETAAQVRALGRRALPLQVDVRDSAQLDDLVGKAVAELGRLDIVIANAGVQGNPGPIAATSAAEFADVIGTNLVGVFNTVHAGLPHLLAGGRGGSIVLTSSSIALRAVPNLGPYGSAKTGILGLMRTLALELGEHGIRVNSVHPTTVRTPMLINDVNFRMFRPDLAEPTLEDVIPVYTSLNVLPVPFVEVEDVANAVLFLVSDEARFITGVALPVDAGFTLK